MGKEQLDNFLTRCRSHLNYFLTRCRRNPSVVGFDGSHSLVFCRSIQLSSAPIVFDAVSKSLDIIQSKKEANERLSNVLNASLSSVLDDIRCVGFKYDDSISLSQLEMAFSTTAVDTILNKYCSLCSLALHSLLCKFHTREQNPTSTEINNVLTE